MCDTSSNPTKIHGFEDHTLNSLLHKSTVSSKKHTKTMLHLQHYREKIQPNQFFDWFEYVSLTLYED